MNKKDKQLLAEAYNNILINEINLIGSGEHFDVYEDDSDEDMDNTVIKKPKKGNKISPIEIKKHQFMKQNESSNVFIKIFNIKPDAIWAEKADTETANNICWKFAQEYLEMSGNEENIEDDDMISDYIMDDILSPKTTIDWKWVKQITNDFNPNDDFVIAANYLLDYHNRLKLIKKWPVSTFDIHAENVGIVNRDGVEMLVIIDF